jgi:hypothetical protein
MLLGRSGRDDREKCIKVRSLALASQDSLSNGTKWASAISFAIATTERKKSHEKVSVSFKNSSE